MPRMVESPFNAFKPLAGRALEAALARALALDPDTRAALARLDGRTVALRIAQPPLALQLTVEGEGLRVGPVQDQAAAPDLSVRATLGGLLSQIPGLQRDGAGTPGRLRIEGDAELARELQRLAQRFDPDWQQPFTALFGDVLGVQVANMAASALRGGRDAATSFAQASAEYVVEESRDVVGRDELEAFHDDVDAVRDDVDRLAARIARLPRSGAAA